MNSMGKTIFISVMLGTVFCAGCSEGFQNQANNFIADVNAATVKLLNTADKVIADVNNTVYKNAPAIASTVGTVSTVVSATTGLPAIDWSALILGFAGAISFATNIWQKWRGSQLKTVTKAIVKGVEAAGVSAETVKSAIKSEMQSAEILSTGNVIVEQLKNA